MWPLVGECPQELAFRISLSALRPQQVWGQPAGDSQDTAFAPGRSLLSERVPSGNMTWALCECSSLHGLLPAPPGCPRHLRVFLPGAPPSSPNPGDCRLRFSVRSSPLPRVSLTHLHQSQRGRRSQLPGGLGPLLRSAPASPWRPPARHRGPCALTPWRSSAYGLAPTPGTGLPLPLSP